jgi:hypothetical protein
MLILVIERMMLWCWYGISKKTPVFLLQAQEVCGEAVVRRGD